jgi:membrane protein YqaA with SNARE-associated domain
MGRLVDRLRGFALAWGAPGLSLVAFLDSSFVPLPGITDILLIVMVTRLKQAMPLYVLASTVGSVAGSLVMHRIGRSGGEALVRRRFAGPNVERALASLQRHGVLAVLIPCLLPPPAPFKLFLLLAGAAGISAGRFATAIAIGRGARYLALGFLAVEYGERASQYVAEHGAAVSLAIVGVLSAGFAAYLVRSKARAAKSR